MIHGPNPAGVAGTWAGPRTTFQTTTRLKTSFCDYRHTNVQTDTSSTTEDAGTVGNASRSCTASKTEIQSLCNIHTAMRNMLPYLTNGKQTHQAWGSNGAARTDPKTHQIEDNVKLRQFAGESCQNLES